MNFRNVWILPVASNQFDNSCERIAMAEPCQTKPGRCASWGRVEHDVIFLKTISMGARYTYSAIACLTDRDGVAEFCQATLADKAGRSRAWVNSMVRELERAGLLRVERVFVNGLQLANRYTLTDRLERGDRNRRAGSVGETTNPTSNGEALFETAGETVHENGKAYKTAGTADRPGVTAVKPADTSQDSDSHLSLKCPGERASVIENRGEVLDQTALTQDWQPDAADLDWALGVCPELDTQAFTERFVLGCLAKGYRYADYRAGWRKWLAEPKGSLPLRSTIADQSPILSGDAQHLAAFNANRARVCLERLMGRGTSGPLA
jgi:DNA-binding Lrp family transcriptional regulator